MHHCMAATMELSGSHDFCLCCVFLFYIARYMVSSDHQKDVATSLSILL